MELLFVGHLCQSSIFHNPDDREIQQSNVLCLIDFSWLFSEQCSKAAQPLSSKSTWLNSSYEINPGSSKSLLNIYYLIRDKSPQGSKLKVFATNCVLSQHIFERASTWCEKTKVKRIWASKNSIFRQIGWKCHSKDTMSPAISNTHEAIKNFCFVKPYTRARAAGLRGNLRRFSFSNN